MMQFKQKYNILAFSFSGHVKDRLIISANKSISFQKAELL